MAQFQKCQHSNYQYPYAQVVVLGVQLSTHSIAIFTVLTCYSRELRGDHILREVDEPMEAEVCLTFFLGYG